MSRKRYSADKSPTEKLASGVRGLDRACELHAFDARKRLRLPPIGVVSPVNAQAAYSASQPKVKERFVGPSYAAATQAGGDVEYSAVGAMCAPAHQAIADRSAASPLAADPEFP